MNIRLLHGRRYFSAVILIGALTASGCSSTLPDAISMASAKPGTTEVGYGALNPNKAPKKHRLASTAELNSPAEDVRPMKAVQTAYFGNATYICSPSGFGQKSKCSLRSGKIQDLAL
ncbi:hypothetical protein ACG873_25930 [Mesorhizobium sp. AaZ16]|uniref:hypothetical protein n=1 Tax=Mesorhizobium sp. AaZ16 TaxID=3402289 RepID=UPI00374EC412